MRDDSPFRHTLADKAATFIQIKNSCFKFIDIQNEVLMEREDKVESLKTHIF